ncbi:MAG TPA: hypothetical protein VL728_17655 [Cyclobacteriaceae bacterium]|jgi:hypothetical protein|nr:hypothetical protein [Cyclobacteriaceae bacterium]
MSCLKYIVILLLLIGTAAGAQEKFNEALTEKAKTYFHQNLTEKLFVHTDRESYLAGEILWFKVYEVVGSQHKALPLNLVTYVELLDKNNQPVAQQKIAMKDGFGDGSIFLSTSITSGAYVFRAYTNWMKNSEPDFYFQKSISIVNAFIKRDLALVTEPPTIEATFFPEGGNLVAGINNRVAFKVNNEFGKGVDFSGFLVNDGNDTVAKFSPLKFGIGNFRFIPSAGSRYRALIKVGKQRKTIDFSAPTDGYALQLRGMTDKIKISVFHPSASENEPVCLFIHAHQIIAKAEIGFLKNDSASFWMNKSDMPEGITHITVFTKDLKPVAERLYFRKPSSKLSVDVHTDKRAYSKREKVALTLETNLNSNLSASIIRLDSLTGGPTRHISEFLWMTSDLKGNVESPEYYFSDDPFVEEAQDNLMLTHGWRRFKWKDVLEQRQLVRFPPEYGGHFLQATILDEKNQPSPNTIGFASVVGKNVNLNCAQSDEKGEVFFEVKNLIGPQKVVLQTNLKKDSLKHVEVRNPFSSEYSPMRLSDAALRRSVRATVLERSISLQTQLIYAEDALKKTLPPVIDSLPFYGSPSERYLLDDYTRFPVMEEVMREYVPGVMVRINNNKFRFIVLDAANHTVFSETPLILLDGVPLFHEDEIMHFDPLRIRKLDVITQKYFLGPAVFPGIVSYTTYKGDLGGFQLNPKCVTLNYEGLELQREFYSPDYSAKSNTRIPDFRTLIYWNPSIEITAKRQQKFEFFTSDLPGKYQITIEGISKQGNSGSAVFSFTVE